MIDLYTWGTPNGYKASIMLEECGLPYTVQPVNLRADEQRRPEFLAVNPNGRIPAIHDRETGQSVFESGAILLYLAEKSGRFLPAEPKQRWSVMSWLMWQMGGVGPMFGQAGWFNRRAPEVTYGVERYTRETARLLGVLDRQLAGEAHVACDDYTIADIIIYPWVRIFPRLLANAPADARQDWPHVRRWLAAVGARPAVMRGVAIPHAE